MRTHLLLSHALPCLLLFSPCLLPLRIQQLPAALKRPLLQHLSGLLGHNHGGMSRCRRRLCLHECRLLLAVAPQHAQQLLLEAVCIVQAHARQLQGPPCQWVWPHEGASRYGRQQAVWVRDGSLQLRWEAERERWKSAEAVHRQIASKPVDLQKERSPVRQNNHQQQAYDAEVNRRHARAARPCTT